MPWIETTDYDSASGALLSEYDAALKREGKICNIVKISSLTPDLLANSMSFYCALMCSKGELTRAQREMIAVVVSRVNDCFY